MKVAINYADKPYREAQKYNTKTAYKKGQVNRVIEYGPHDIDKEYLNQHGYAFVQNNPRIGKYGLWRPHIIMQTLNKINHGDYIIYCDSGAYYLNDVNHLIQKMHKENVDLLLFEDSAPEKSLTKRDIFVYMGLDYPKYTDTKQRISTFFVIRKSDWSEKFFNEYFELANNAAFLFTDEKNKLGFKNYPEFLDTRHNQSVLSLLSKKYSVPAFRDPSQWGNGQGVFTVAKNILLRKIYHTDYPTIFISHRSKKVSIKLKIKVYFKNLFPNISRLIKQMKFI